MQIPTSLQARLLRRLVSLFACGLIAFIYPYAESIALSAYNGVGAPANKVIWLHATWLGIDDRGWVPTVFSKNRDRLLNTDLARKFLAAILAHDKVAPLLSDDHFSVDGRLVEAWASFKSLRPKEPAANSACRPDDPPPPAAGASSSHDHPSAADPAERQETPMQTTQRASRQDRIGRNVERDWRGNAWSNATHASVTDPDARLLRKGKGKPAQLCYMGHALMETGT